METEIKKIACIGGGLIGSAWTTLFSKYGYTVNFYDINDSAIDAAKKNMDGMFKQYLDVGLMSEQEVAEAKTHISYFTDLGEAVKAVDFIQENVPEKIEIKKQVLSQIDEYNPTAIYASSASALRISDIAEGSKYPERCLNGHPFNPPHLMPIVELVSTKHTAQDVIDKAMAFYESMKRVPVILNKEIYGFIGNRLQYAFVREAMNLVASGVCSVEAVDKVAVYGLGIRWAFLGPWLIGELNGGPGGIYDYFDHYREAWKMAFEELADFKELQDVFVEEMAKPGVAEELANRTEEEGRTNEELKAYRDKMLIEILKMHNKI